MVIEGEEEVGAEAVVSGADEVVLQGLENQALFALLMAPDDNPMLDQRRIYRLAALA